MLLSRAAIVSLGLLLPAVALAQRSTTQDALHRMEESVELHAENGTFSMQEVLPAIVVSVRPAFEETKAWYPTAALASLVRVFGADALRMCEACMAARVSVEDGRLEENTSGPDVAEIVRIDENARGSAPPAKTAIWLDETPNGVALRIVDLRNSRIVHAENFDPTLYELSRSDRNFTLTRELGRRMRGDAITHTFFDVAVYPGQHFSLDFVEQWGDGNQNLSGLTLSLFDPVLGVGAAYYRVVPRALNIMVGAQVVLSVPTALVSAITNENQQLIDPLVTAVGVVRIPIATSNYGILLMASTNGRIGVGLSLMNVSLLPVIP
ncbi:MAG: hypothetical protein IRZ16_23355 [Myxococcaceae bacterium]|nr:hypothetical protein [Myxococcaceae bacterium]